MTIYIDIGNTNLKVGFLINKNWKIHIFNFQQENYILELKKIIKSHNFKSAWISSTNPNKQSEISDCLLHLKINFITENTKLKLNVQNISEVGSDIIANAVFASTKSNNIILFSFGTAVVVSHIKNNSLEGCAIIPGIQSLLNALSKDTAKIGDIKIINKVSILGKDTIEAVSSGIINLYKYFIEGFIKDIDPSADIIITGAGAKVIKNLTSHNIVEETVLKGLYEISKINE